LKAITLDSPAASPALHEDVEAPAPAANQVLVRVQTSSVNPVDNAIARGMLREIAEHEYPVTLGRDYAGVVEHVGDEVTRYREGDEVFGFIPFGDPKVQKGTWADLFAVREDISIAHRPAGVDVAAAGAAPLAAITAMAAVDAVEPSEGDTVLVAGATGGVGSFAVQLVAHGGATVIAPALPEDEEYLRGLGVGELVEREGDVAAAVRERHPDGVDAVIDLVSYEPGAFDAALAPRGRVASPNSAAGEGSGRTNIVAIPSPENLERLGTLLAEGTLKVPIQDSYELERAAEALEALGSTHTRGKLAIRVA
jgi:NADPH:quinone reductase